MYETLAPVRSLDSDRLLLPTSTTDGARLPLADRLELRVGLWLLLRSARRLDSARSHVDHTRHLENERSRADRESAFLRTQSLHSLRA